MIYENKTVVDMKNINNISILSEYSIGISYLEAQPEKENVILFIHANSASKEFFEPLMREPALDGFRLLAVDLPGHGKSDNFPPAFESVITKDETKLFDYFDNFYTFPGYANVIKEFLAQLRIKSNKVTIFGWSLGGHIAIDLFQKNPSFAKVILTGTPINDFDKMARGFEALSKFETQAPFPKGLTVLELLGYNESFTEEQAQAWHQLVGIAPSEMTKAAGTVTNPRARHYMIKFAFDAPKFKNKLQSMGYEDQGKTVAKNPEKFIVLQGAKDFIKIQGADKDRLESIKVKINEIENAGHALFYEIPEQVAKFIAMTASLALQSS